MSILEKTAAGLASLVALAAVGTAAAQQPAPKPATPKPPQHQAPAAPAPAPQAQVAPAPAPAAVDQNPTRTTASYGDWVVRCDSVAGPPPQKNCEMEQFAQMQGQANPISRVAIPLPAKGEPPKMFVLLPNYVSFIAPLKITTNDKDAGITAPFRRCVPAGCFVEIELKDDLQKKFRAAAAEPGKIMFKDATDRDVTLPLSFKGFAQAFDALLKQ
jgi:invasion protein IalB